MIRLALAALVAISATVTAAADTPLMTWRDLLSRPRPHADATVHYGPDANQVIDVWRPARRVPGGTVVMVHGGCWTTSIADPR